MTKQKLSRPNFSPPSGLYGFRTAAIHKMESIMEITWCKSKKSSLGKSSCCFGNGLLKLKISLSTQRTVAVKSINSVWRKEKSILLTFSKMISNPSGNLETIRSMATLTSVSKGQTKEQTKFSKLRYI